MVKFEFFADAYTNLIKVRGASMVNTPYKQTNNAINKLTQEFTEMRSEVLGSVNADTNLHKEILTYINQYQDLPSLNSSQISSISNSEQMTNINNNNRNLQQLILQLKNKINKLKPKVTEQLNHKYTKQIIDHINRQHPISCRIITEEKTPIIIAGGTEHLHIQAQSKKRQPQETNLMPLLKVKKGGSFDFCADK